MNREYKIKNRLNKVGREVILADGDWLSAPSYAVIQHNYKKNKTNFENKLSEIGYISKDYYTYIGPFDHDITALSRDAVVLSDGRKYIFKKRERILCQSKILFYFAILKRVWEDEDELQQQSC